ncbi:MFS transporter [Desulfogranum japonicum]|uniref:MFS transporter n=1 Tax=Desulfogranum japonicum TaxID=231447 RepID=UPI000410F129|nr:MFS transporter [Desulfogranum japonicum]
MNQIIARQTATHVTRKTFFAMAATYCLGVFNDNYFKQAAMLLAVTAGLSHLQGWATMLFAAPFILFASLGGWCADRFSKKRVVIAAKAVEVVAMLVGAFGMITGQWQCIMAMVFMMGAQSTLFSPSLNGTIPELFPAEQVPKANAALKLGSTLAILLGVALAGCTLDFHAMASRGITAQHLVSGIVLCCSLIGFAASLAVKSGPAAVASRSFPWLGPLNSVQDLISTTKDRQLFVAILANTYFYFTASFTILLINTMAIEEFQFSQTRTSMLSMVLMLGVCCGSFLAAKSSPSKKWTHWLAPGALGMGAGLYAATLTKFAQAPMQWYTMAASLLLSGIAGGLFLIPVTSFLQIRPPREEKGRTLATASFCSFVAILLSGLLFNMLQQQFTPSTTMLLLAILNGCSAILFLCIPGVKKMITSLILFLLRLILKTRYSITVKGLEELKVDNRKPVLFLPNHPALIDPVIVLTTLYRRFRPSPLAAAEQVERPIIRHIAHMLNTIALRRPGYGGQADMNHVHATLQEVVDTMKKGGNILLYPGGKLMRSSQESLGGNSAVEYILKQVPETQVVLLRTSGLWGSSFSRASGVAPEPEKHIGMYLKSLLSSGLFFMPRRAVTIECYADLEVTKLHGRQEINRYLEAFYNATPQSNTFVPYYWWQGRLPQNLPEPELAEKHTMETHINDSVTTLVIEKIQQVTGTMVTRHQSLTRDLALDSLSIMELVSWMELEFAISIPDPAQLETVTDCIRVAAGIPMAESSIPAVSAPAKWKHTDQGELHVPAGETLTKLLLHQAEKQPDSMIMADQMSGPLTYRQLITGIFALLPRIQHMQGDCVGIMLPPSVACVLAYYTVVFSGKTPVMLNWTTGYANVSHAVKTTGIQHVISAKPMLEKIGSQQNTDYEKLPVRWLFMEQFQRSLSKMEKIRAYCSARFFPQKLAEITPAKTAAILFTSGSESRPKAVPLSHGNFLSNLRDMAALIRFQRKDCLLGMLPPFHSLGLAGTVIMPLSLGLRTVYSPNPTEPSLLSQTIKEFNVSTLITTPTFLQGILGACKDNQLHSVQRIFTGAEKCPEQVLEQLRMHNPDAILCEGYGITECSPLVSLNTPAAHQWGTIGQVLPSVEYVLVNDALTACVPQESKGILLVRGPSIFSGYLNSEAKSPFCHFAGKNWYNTGDYVQENEQGYLRFCGRKKRFVKIGGEMISLPAIEETLLAVQRGSSDTPSLAVETAEEDGRPELVLFTTTPLSREMANKRLREAGLSGLHNIRRVVQLEQIPLLGTGKTDYQQLRKLAA